MSDDIRSITSGLSTWSMYNKSDKYLQNCPKDSDSSLSDFTIPKGHHHLDIYSITSTSQPHTLSNSQIDQSQDELFSGSVCTQDPVPLCAFTSSSNLGDSNSSQSYNSPENGNVIQSKMPPDYFDLHSSSLSPVPGTKQDIAEISNKSPGSKSDLRLSTLNEQGSPLIGVHSSSYSVNPPQSKIMKDLSLLWRRKSEDEERLAKTLTVPCTGPYHRLYGMSRITAHDNTQRITLIVDSKATVQRFILYLCTDPKSKDSKIIVIVKHTDITNNDMIELCGPWSTFAAGIYFYQYFNLSHSQEPPSVIFNPASINGAKATTFQNK